MWHPQFPRPAAVPHEPRRSPMPSEEYRGEYDSSGPSSHNNSNNNNNSNMGPSGSYRNHSHGSYPYASSPRYYGTNANDEQQAYANIPPPPPPPYSGNNPQASYNFPPRMMHPPATTDAYGRYYQPKYELMERKSSLAVGGGCTCKKSRCLKLYCQCFASSKTCGPKCKCQSCHNTTLHGRDIDDARRIILERNPSAFEDKFEAGDENHPPINKQGPPTEYPGYPPREAPPAAMRPPTGFYAPPPPPRHQWPMNNAQPHAPPPPPPPSHEAYREEARAGSVENVPPRASPSTVQQDYNAGAYGVNANHTTAASFAADRSKQWKPVLPTKPHVASVVKSDAAAATESSLEDADQNRVLAHKSGCKCRRSFCLKKYCECYHHGAKCGTNCRCVNCHNKPESGEKPPEDVAFSTSGTNQQARQETEQKAPSLPNVVVCHQRVVPQTIEEEKKEEPKPEQDRMAIMAAVAMTELLGGRSAPETSETRKEEKPSSRPVSISPTAVANEEDKKTNCGRKRKNSDDAESTMSLKKRQLSPPNTQECDDNSVRNTVSSGSSASGSPSVGSVAKENSSRIPSPVHMLPYSQYGGHSFRLHNVPHPHPYPYYTGQPQHPQHPPRMYPAGPPLPPRQPLHVMDHHMHNGRHPMGGSPSMHHKLPPTPEKKESPAKSTGSSNQTPSRTSNNSTNPNASVNPANSGLPKALSFRKICSKCGKTRGEHHDLGFGNKCVYQDCGRCGAGVQMHIKAQVPMGFLCTLTVEDGATHGAAEAYERKIHDLAVRAEMQRGIAKQQQQQSTPKAAAVISAV